jgi:uncharacterized low-complexity protein
MSEKRITKPVAVAVGTALAGSFAIGSTAAADTSANPFAMTSLSSGYMLTLGEGSCGGDKGTEASCGGDKDGDGKDKAEGSCGEGSCGGAKDDKGEAEGSCGGAKDGEGKEKAEGSCGEGSCAGAL